MREWVKKVRTYSGTKDGSVSEREIANRKVARRAAAEGMVLLKNEGVLPLKAGCRVALYGGAAVQTVKGGTGSGDVNEREVVSIYQGLKEEDLVLTNEDWLTEFGKLYKKARDSWKADILRQMKEEGKRLFEAYSTTIFHMPAGGEIREEEVRSADAVFYCIGRTAGEDADRFEKEGDYYLTEAEKSQLEKLNAYTENLIVILNTGGAMDLKFIQGLSHLKGLISIVQPGMEGGHALADLLMGRTNFSGRLTSTWAKNYEDIPFAMDYSHNNGNVEKELYREGIYVGYRYFDSFDVKTAYNFGYGLSYTEFGLNVDAVEQDGAQICVTVSVTNQGDRAGKEVVEIYVSCPQTGIEKEYRKLCGFAKTKELKPGETQKLTVQIPVKNLAAFDEVQSAWILEAGEYGLWVGDTLDSAVISGVVKAEQEIVLEKTAHICPLQEELDLLSLDEKKRREKEQAWKKAAKEKGAKKLTLCSDCVEKAVEKQEISKKCCEESADAGKEKTADNCETARVAANGSADTCDSLNACDSLYAQARAKATEITKKLTKEQMISMVIGEISKGQGQSQVLGAAGIMVPGAAGETSGVLEEKFGVPGVSMADGPAGLRLMKSYEVDRGSGKIYNPGILGALEGGFFADQMGQTEHENADKYYQYCTAIPVGTLLAQSWNTELLSEVGKAVAVEMAEFGVSWWLAPGMNIHRNPLCGRNFEYYSEDPLISGKMAAAITRGVQSMPGVGTTIKHFACNNQEDNRMGCDSVISERTLREIYLRGFEIAVREAQPMAIMTSYNVLNGVHTANSKDLCTVAAREEWGFGGIIMTDWTTTMPHGGSISWKCMEAGNDLIMPGYEGDMESIENALASGELKKEALEACVTRMLAVILLTSVYEDASPYSECGVRA